MRARAVWLGVLVAISSGAAGYLMSRVVGYQRMERDAKIEEALTPEVRPRSDLPRTENPGDPKGDPTVAPGEIPLPPRVASDDPERAAKAAAIVLPELAPDLASKGLRSGDRVFLRIFKAERELELWIFHRADLRYRLFKTYPVAGMSGGLGPKLAEGDFQAPEGFYKVGPSQMNPKSDYHLSFDLGFPNEFDLSQGRTGSYLMVHGGDRSVGCFAVTDRGVEEIFSLADASLRSGTPYFLVHAFPFRMTEEAMAKAGGHKWFAFWENLRDGYRRFEERGVPPEVSVGGGIYLFQSVEDPGGSTRE